MRAYIDQYRVKEVSSHELHPNKYPAIILVPREKFAPKLGIRILAGCRTYTYAQAKRHWADRLDRANFWNWISSYVDITTRAGFLKHDRR